MAVTGPNWLLSASSNSSSNVLRGFRLLEEPAEGVVAELAGDVFQRPQVVARPVGRRDQEEEQVHHFAVEAGEIDALRG